MILYENIIDFKFDQDKEKWNVKTIVLVYIFTNLMFILQYYARKTITEMVERVMGTSRTNRGVSRNFFLASKVAGILNFCCSLYLIVGILVLITYMVFYVYTTSILYFAVVFLLNVALVMAMEGSASSYRSMHILKSFRYARPFPKNTNSAKPGSDM
jgi:hypothetical protein